MTGNELKIELKKANIKQEDASIAMGITRRTLQNWLALEKLDANMMQLVRKVLHIDEQDECNIDVKTHLLIESQQATIEHLSETINRQSKIIETLTSKL